MSGSNALKAKDPENRHDPMALLSKHYTERINQEATKNVLQEKTEAGMFLEQYGDLHLDALEKRLSDFISAASDVSLRGVRFVGPSRHTSSNVLLACKEILENNAARIKLDGGLHSRVDMQLILMENAARRLESMEADGGSPEAVASGSVLTVCAKLIRSLYRVMWEWKRNYAVQKTQLCADQQQAAEAPFADAAAPSWPPFPAPSEDYLTSDFFTDWDAWPPLGPADMSSLFTFDIDTNLNFQ